MRSKQSEGKQFAIWIYLIDQFISIVLLPCSQNTQLKLLTQSLQHFHSMRSDFKIDLISIILILNMDSFSPTDVLSSQVVLKYLRMNQSLIKIEHKSNPVFIN